VIVDSIVYHWPFSKSGILDFLTVNFFFVSLHVLVCLFLQIPIFLLEGLDYDVVVASSFASHSPAVRFVVWVLSPEKLDKSLCGSAFLKRHKLILTLSDVVV